MKDILLFPTKIYYLTKKNQFYHFILFLSLLSQPRKNVIGLVTKYQTLTHRTELCILDNE